jgi:hypothetical protein
VVAQASVLRDEPPAVLDRRRVDESVRSAGSPENEDGSPTAVAAIAGVIAIVRTRCESRWSHAASGIATMIRSRTIRASSGIRSPRRPSGQAMKAVLGG